MTFLSERTLQGLIKKRDGTQLVVDNVATVIDKVEEPMEKKEMLREFNTGERLKELRLEDNFYIGQVARGCKVSRQVIYNWESNRILSSHRLLQVCAVFGITPDEFFQTGKFER